MRNGIVSLVVLMALAALSMCAASATAQQQAPPGGTTFIYCGALLAVPGEAPIENATIVVRDGVIERVERGRAPADRRMDTRIIDLSDRFVMPGMIDCHTHIGFEMDPRSRMRMVEESDADAALRGAVYARRTLDAGFTTIRNVGSMGDSVFALRDAINRGDAHGPTILAAGHSITPTGGHGDRTHGFREGLFAVPGAFQGVADGADGCRQAVRAQVKRGADVIKLTATGGVLSVTDAGTAQQFFDDELSAIVQTSHRLGRKVAAHAHGVDGINAALRAGVDSIEHGTYLDDESIELFKQNGAYLVPTLLAGKTVVDIAAGENNYFHAAVRRKALSVGPVMIKNFGKAYRAGVKIAFGTDSGVSVHGTNADEFDLMVSAGMSLEDAVYSATVAAADLCGIGDRVGTIEVGKRADIVAFGSSPLEGVEAFHDVRFVMHSGRVHRND